MPGDQGRVAHLVVIGGGPAGLACAGEATRLGLRTVLVEGLALGGELNTISTVAGLVPHRADVQGPDLAADLIEEALDAGVDVIYEQARTLQVVDGHWVVNEGAVRAGALVLATGREHDLGGVPGAASLHGRGVSTCSSCDGPLFKDKDVLVLGGGRDAAAMVKDLQGLVTSVAVLPREPLSTADHTFLDPTGVEVWSPTDHVRLAAGEDGTTVILNAAGDEIARKDGIFLAIERRPRDELLSAIEPTGGSARPFHTHAGDVKADSSQTVIAAIGDGVTAAWSAMSALATTTH